MYPPYLEDVTIIEQPEAKCKGYVVGGPWSWKWSFCTADTREVAWFIFTLCFISVYTLDTSFVEINFDTYKLRVQFKTE
jgi:hypothetical protein